mmetsp:Transcript_22562/g.53256  ORF Transcript_22562/g.53256 Transcript_22562/m.53256 type:complete len:209 (-) Transcript_22562:1791-2417(-)
MIMNDNIMEDYQIAMNTKQYTSSNEINPNDVLCGRGGLTNSHIGNKEFRYVVAEYQQEYLHSRKNDKKEIARKIVSQIEEKGGRFLQRTADSSVWSEVTQKKALEKTSQALREGLDVRHKKVRPEKLVRRLGNTSGRGKDKTGRQPKIVEGTVMEVSGVSGLSGAEDIPDLIHDVSPTHSFEPMFTIRTLQDDFADTTNTDIKNIHQI